MKWTSIFFLLLSFHSHAQEDSTYSRMLMSAKEITITDSLLIGTEDWQLQRLDSNDVKKWFSPLLGFTANNRLKNRSYFLVGKISTNPGYDLLILMEEKKKDSSGVEVIHLVTAKKRGQYISSKELAVSGTRKKNDYNIFSWLYPDMRFRKVSNYTINGKPMHETENYMINPNGRFILSINQ